MVFSSLDASFDSLLFSLLGCLRRILIDDQVLGRVNFWQPGSGYINFGRRDGFSALWMQISVRYFFLDGLHKNLAARLRIYCKNTIRASTSDLEKREFLAARLRIYCKNTIRASTSDLEKREFLVKLKLFSVIGFNKTFSNILFHFFLDELKCRFSDGNNCYHIHLNGICLPSSCLPRWRSRSH
ncbi:hypothetical protein RhiirA4_431440 [Rhizophagus irregularis]|uniref:Uncharacterized protein n=1 Tax=Rhizophagus irregularis TaxID=588596 RepID=A0A2I1HQ10_9GLOM|nr:hypothetical protein RhiirA4_431440 [Rhizophagus irregularis]